MKKLSYNDLLLIKQGSSREWMIADNYNNRKRKFMYFIKDIDGNVSLFLQLEKLPNGSYKIHSNGRFPDGFNYEFVKKLGVCLYVQLEKNEEFRVFENQIRNL